MAEYSAYVGLGVPKKTFVVPFPGWEASVYRGAIANKRSSSRRLVGNLSPYSEALSFCYETGPCGYGVYREMVATGHECAVVAPSLIPRCSADRLKTDRRAARPAAPRPEPDREEPRRSPRGALSGRAGPTRPVLAALGVVRWKTHPRSCANCRCLTTCQ